MSDYSPIGDRSDTDDELIVSAHSDRLRARIHAMPSGGFCVDLEELIDAEDAGGMVRGTFWSKVVGETSYTYSMDLARQLAAAKLTQDLN
jgi:hypothetical protein